MNTAVKDETVDVEFEIIEGGKMSVREKLAERLLVADDKAKQKKAAKEEARAKKKEEKEAKKKEKAEKKSGIGAKVAAGVAIATAVGAGIVEIVRHSGSEESLDLPEVGSEETENEPEEQEETEE